MRFLENLICYQLEIPLKTCSSRGSREETVVEGMVIHVFCLLRFCSSSRKIFLRLEFGSVDICTIWTHFSKQVPWDIIRKNSSNWSVQHKKSLSSSLLYNPTSSQREQLPNFHTYRYARSWYVVGLPCWNCISKNTLFQFVPLQISCACIWGPAYNKKGSQHSTHTNVVVGRGCSKWPSWFPYSICSKLSNHPGAQRWIYCWRWVLWFNRSIIITCVYYSL